MVSLFFVLFVSFLSSQNVLLEIGERNIFDVDFFQNVPKSIWLESGQEKKFELFNDFKNKEVVFHHSMSVGFNLFPENFIKLKKRRDQILINSYYENVVALPLFDQEYLKETKKHINSKVFVHHILIGYKGCSLNGGVFDITKKEALKKSLEIKADIDKLFSFSEVDSLVSVFQASAKKTSDDPSVYQNRGEIGWVSWGQVMPSFQKKAFDIDVLTVSEPVLTDFGYHLILVEKKGFSDYYYYNEDYVEGLLVKFALQHTNIDSLKSKASSFDSLYIQKNDLVFNDTVLNEAVLLFENKTKKNKLRGGKSSYVDWLKEIKGKKVLFVFKDEGYGIGWLINKIEKSPSTRIRPLKNKNDFRFLINSFLLEKGVLEKAFEHNLSSSRWIDLEMKKHTKNILYKSFEKFSIEGLPPIDSSFVKNLYEKGVFKGDYIKPKQVVFSEIRVSSFNLADSLLNDFLTFNDFDKLMKGFGGNLKKPISDGGGGFIGEAAFALSPGEVSGIISNLDKTFSIIRVESFIDEEPFVLDRVYSQIENKIRKNLKDSVKKNLSVSLLSKYKIKEYMEVLSF